MAAALFCAAVMGLLTIPGAAAQAEHDYDGDNDGLIEVADLAQLNAIRWDLDGDGAADDSANEASYAAAYPDPATGMGCPSTGCIGYELTANLNFSGSTWASDPGWAPIAEYLDGAGIPFIATFDGNDNSISNLYINRTAVVGVGLFGYVGSGAEIRNVRLLGGTVTGQRHIGGLVGVNNGGAVSNSRATGNVTGSASSDIGGLVGYNAGTISASHHETGMVSGSQRVGGLAGQNAGTIEDSTAGGVVSGQDQIGGLVGRNHAGTINRSHASGAVSGQRWTGGLVGTNAAGADIISSHAAGKVTGTGTSASIGGLVGYNGGTIRDNSYATGVVTGDGPVGGLAGYNDGTISRGHASGAVFGRRWTGGLAGTNAAGADIISSLAAGDVTGTGTSQYIGGLVGYNGGTIRDNSYATGAVTGDSVVGGLVGMNEDGAISTSHATGDVTGTGTSQYIGGLVGDNHGLGTIRDNSYATGAVTGHREVGGLVGYNSGTISTSHATGDVTGTETTSRSTQIGGLVGLNYGEGTILTSFATGTVTGSQGSGEYTGEHTGGLVGANQGGTIRDTYSSSTVIGSDNIGGLVGANINSPRPRPSRHHQHQLLHGSSDGHESSRRSGGAELRRSPRELFHGHGHGHGWFRPAGWWGPTSVTHSAPTTPPAPSAPATPGVPSQARQMSAGWWGRTAWWGRTTLAPSKTAIGIPIPRG